MIGYAILLAMICIALFVIYSAYAAHVRLQFTNEAWSCRQNIAEITNRINLDENAPEDVKGFINCLADHAFNEDFIKNIVSSSEKKTKRKEIRGGLLKYLRKQHGNEYAQIIYEALRQFSAITFLYEKKLYHILRHTNAIKNNLNFKRLRGMQAKLVFEQIYQNDCHA